MKKILSHITRGPSKSKQSDVSAPLPQPETPFLAIGDIHGRADLLLQLDKLIEKNFSGWPVVFLGDYIDRGEESCEVLKLLMSVSPEGSPPVTCLMGNHERMLLDFLDRPSQYARRWVHNGGLQTLASFGVSLKLDHLSDDTAMASTRDQLLEAMGNEMVDWLRARPLSWQSGNVWAAHAGADPTEPMETQEARDLLWGHPKFTQDQREDGQWVVHGHTIVDVPFAQDGRIAVDTGAYATGVLTAAVITGEEVSFIQTPGG
ncbi:serine/threonine protein phosphatase [Rhodobacteraceae bacterium 63075]|nr:serine/threonine protein phosphatase [Rhodobacteraceae bacterium 63075]